VQVTRLDACHQVARGVRIVMTVAVCCAGTGQPAKTKVRRKERSKAKLLPQVECHFGRDIPDLSTPLLRHIANGDKVRMVRVG
jgi:hypothetical protein